MFETISFYLWQVLAACMLGITFAVQAVKASKPTFGQNESESDRLARMRQYWQSKDNAVLVPLGQLLAMPFDAKRTVAEVVAGGGEVTIDKLQMPDGKVLEVSPAQVISLKTCADKQHGWGCPACSSAHGSGIAPSRDVTVDGLARNQWYYNPASKQLRVISDTCIDKYCHAFGAVTPARFGKEYAARLLEVLGARKARKARS